MRLETFEEDYRSMYFLFLRLLRPVLIFLQRDKVAVKAIRSHCVPESEKGRLEKVSFKILCVSREAQAKAETWRRK